MTRTIVFVGNCQMGVLAKLYRQLNGSSEQDIRVTYVASYEDAGDEQRRTMAAATIMVKQVQDFVPRIGDIETNATIHFVPHISAPFLWPCTGQQHPRNAPHRYSDASGPYAGEIGDSFLNRMIVASVDPDEAVSRYMNVDLAALRRVDRMSELFLEKQRARDLACGYNFAEYIDRHFRTERLFRTPNHPTAPLTRKLATEVFERVGIDDNALQQVKLLPGDGLFPVTEMPVHPSIIAHFGLTFVGPDTRYRYCDEGRFTCAEYAGRYMRYEWNPLLGEGYELARLGPPDAAIVVLRKALQLSPRSAAGHSVLSDVLNRMGRLTEAVDLAATAARLEPENQHYAGRYAHLQSLHASERAGEQVR